MNRNVKKEKEKEEKEEKAKKELVTTVGRTVLKVKGAGRGMTCEEPQKDPHGWTDEDRGGITASPGLESKAPGSSLAYD